MIAKSFPLFVLFLMCLVPAFNLRGDTELLTSPPQTNSLNQSKKEPHFDPFTGKIVKNRVRLRLRPQFDSQIVRELQRDDLVLVLGETEDFYAVQPTKNIKAYIFRTYVLDNVVEGTRVNVRLKPELDAAVIAQLNSGDRIEGTIAPSHPKWLEIAVPPSARFYIAKEYVEKIGDAGLLAHLEKRREEVNRLLAAAKATSEVELQKSFELMKLDDVIADYQHIICDYAEFPGVCAEAQAWMKELQEAYTAKKMAYLEFRTHESSQILEEKTKQLSEELKTYQARVSELEQQIHKDPAVALLEKETASSKTSPPLLFNMSMWIPVEEALFKAWSEQTGNPSPADFYRADREKSFAIRGILDPYTRPVKNKPGDYMLVDPATRLPIAFLYSTQVNLQEYVGREVSVVVAPRPNNHYAFPAYFVFSVE